MADYRVTISDEASADLDDALANIAALTSDAAGRYVDDIENAVFSLADFPQRGSERNYGRYARRGYRQIFVRKYAIVYEVVEALHMVRVVAIKPAAASF